MESRVVGVMEEGRGGGSLVSWTDATGEEERKRISGVWYVEPMCSMIASVNCFSRGIGICCGCVFSSGSV